MTDCPCRHHGTACPCELVAEYPVSDEEIAAIADYLLLAVECSTTQH